MSDQTSRSIETMTQGNFGFGAEGYVRYCSGLAIIQFPDEMMPVHNRSDISADAQEIIATAEQLMMGGSLRVIKEAQPEAGHTSKNAMRVNFDASLPVMQGIVEYACVRHADRLNRLNAMYTMIRPAPFLGKDVYSYLCHGQQPRISTLRFMDGFQPDPRLLPLLESRKLIAGTVRINSV